MCIIKRRFMESKQNERQMKETVRQQQDKSRQLLAACIYKMKETENYVEKVYPLLAFITKVSAFWGTVNKWKYLFFHNYIV